MKTLQIKIENFDPQAIAKKGKKIISQIYKDFVLLLSKIPRLEEINGIELNSIAWHYSPTIEFLSGNWVYGFGIHSCKKNSLEAKKLWLFRHRKKEKHASSYFTKDNNWKSFSPEYLGIPRDAVTFFLPANKKNKN